MGSRAYVALLLAVLSCTHTQEEEVAPWLKLVEERPTHLIPHLLILGEEGMSLLARDRDDWKRPLRRVPRMTVWPTSKQSAMVRWHSGGDRTYNHALIDPDGSLRNLKPRQLFALPGPAGDRIIGIACPNPSCTTELRWVETDLNGHSAAPERLSMPQTSGARCAVSGLYGIFKDRELALESSCGMLMISLAPVADRRTVRVVERASTCPEDYRLGRYYGDAPFQETPLAQSGGWGEHCN